MQISSSENEPIVANEAVSYRVLHRTVYEYEEEVTLCHSEARLIPRETPGQRVISASVGLFPQASFRSERSDYFGNQTSYFSVEYSHRRLEAVAESRVEIPPRVAPTDRSSWDQVAAQMQEENGAGRMQLRDYMLDSPLAAGSARYLEYARASFPPGRPLLDACEDLNKRIHADFKYESGFSTVSTPLEVVFEHRRGVCQDFAHLFVAALRSLGLAARYVSGYLETTPPPGKEKLQGADASHAWASVYLPGQGWFDFDPTNRQMPQQQHITLAWGRDFSDVTPLKGVIFGGGKHTVTVAVDVQRE